MIWTSSLEPFLHINIILTVSKIEGSIPEEKLWLKRIASWSDKPLFRSFKILVEILFGPSLLSSFKD